MSEEENKYKNILEMPREERIALILKAVREDPYYSEKNGSFETMSEKANEVIEKYFHIGKENPLHVDQDRVYFEPDSRLIGRDGYVVAQGKYGTHFVTYKQNDIRFYDKQKVRNIDIFMEVISEPHERLKQKNGNIVYLRKIDVDNSCCFILRYEINAKGNLTFVGLLPEQTNKQIQKKKASNDLSDAPFGHFPPNLPSEEITSRISGSSVNDPDAYNKDNNNNDTTKKNLHMGGNVENLIEIVERDGEIRWQYEVDESQDRGGTGSATLYDYNDTAYEIITWNKDAEEHEPGSKTIGIGEKNKKSDQHLESRIPTKNKPNDKMEQGSTIKKVATGEGFDYYEGEANGNKFYKIVPEGSEAPTSGWHSKEAAIEKSGYPYNLYDYAPLRSVRVTYDNGFVQNTSMASGLSDQDIRDYFKVGREFNIGSGEHDRIAKVKEVEILKSAGGQVSDQRKKAFIDYVTSFYGKNGIYADYFKNDQVVANVPDGASNDEILKAVNQYIYTAGEKTWGGGDSIDRERVRDIMLEARGLPVDKMEAGGTITKVKVKTPKHPDGVYATVESELEHSIITNMGQFSKDDIIGDKDKRFQFDSRIIKERGGNIGINRNSNNKSHMEQGGRIKPNYRKGSMVVIAKDNDNDSYENYIGKPLRITHVAISEKDHPGFDSGIGQALYDLSVEATGEKVPFSLYDYELKSYKGNRKDFGGILVAGAIGAAIGAGAGYGYRDSITKHKEEALAAAARKQKAAKDKIEEQKAAFREKKENVKRKVIDGIQRLEGGGNVQYHEGGLIGKKVTFNHIVETDENGFLGNKKRKQEATGEIVDRAKRLGSTVYIVQEDSTGELFTLSLGELESASASDVNPISTEEVAERYDEKIEAADRIEDTDKEELEEEKEESKEESKEGVPMMEAGGKISDAKAKLKKEINALEKGIKGTLVSEENKDKMRTNIEKKKAKIDELEKIENADRIEDAERKKKQAEIEKEKKLRTKSSKNKSVYIDIEKSFTMKMRNAVREEGIPYSSGTSGDKFRMFLSNQHQLDIVTRIYNDRRGRLNMDLVRKEQVSSVIKHRSGKLKFVPEKVKPNAKDKLKVEKKRAIKKVEKSRGIKGKLSEE